MPLYDYLCGGCGFKDEFITPMEYEQQCPHCGVYMERLMPSTFGINMGVGAYGYYDETLQTYVNTNRQKRELCRERGVTPLGDTPKPDGEYGA